MLTRCGIRMPRCQPYNLPRDFFFVTVYIPPDANSKNIAGDVDETDFRTCPHPHQRNILDHVYMYSSIPHPYCGLSDHISLLLLLTYTNDDGIIGHNKDMYNLAVIVYINFYRSNSILTRNITNRNGSCTTQDRRAVVD